MGSLVSYLYYKNSVEGSAKPATPESVPVTEPIPIRHRPTAYDPDLQIDLVPEKL